MDKANLFLPRSLKISQELCSPTIKNQHKMIFLSCNLAILRLYDQMKWFLLYFSGEVLSGIHINIYICFLSDIHIHTSWLWYTLFMGSGVHTVPGFRSNILHRDGKFGLKFFPACLGAHVRHGQHKTRECMPSHRLWVTEEDFSGVGSAEDCRRVNSKSKFDRTGLACNLFHNLTLICISLTIC